MSMADMVFRLPPNLATAVRAPETMTMSSGLFSNLRLLMAMLLLWESLDAGVGCFEVRRAALGRDYSE